MLGAQGLAHNSPSTCFMNRCSFGFVAFLLLVFKPIVLSKGPWWSMVMFTNWLDLLYTFYLQMLWFIYTLINSAEPSILNCRSEEKLNQKPLDFKTVSVNRRLRI